MTEDFASTKQKNGEKHVVLTDAKSGKGVNRVKEVALLVSEEVNAKRAAKGLMPRPVRTAIIGYPNVGKSALINRLTNSKACASAPRPGVTRNLRWVRVGGDLDLLDSPGMVDGEMEYPFDVTESIVWLADHVDLILCFFDPIGQALCKRTMNTVARLNENHAEKLAGSRRRLWFYSHHIPPHDAQM